MTKENAINRLKVLREYYKKEGGYLSIANVVALDIAINTLKKEVKIGELTCTNESQFHEADQFICSNCGIKLEGWSRIEYDEDTGDKTYYETSFKFCPNCGAKIESEVK